MVPVLSMVFMVVSLVIAVGLPVALLILARKRYGSGILPAVIGAAAFILFAMVLEQILHMLVLRPDAQGGIALMRQPILYMLYGGFAAGIFEETARFLVFRVFKKKTAGVRNALSYGIGHGGIEAILIVGLSMISNLMLAAIINAGMADTLTVGATAEVAAQTQASIAQLVATPPYMFLLAGAERVMAIAIHIGLSVIVYYAATKKGKLWLYPLAIVLHAVIDFPAALMQAGVLTNVFAVEGLMLAGTVAVVCVAWQVYRRGGERLAAPSAERTEGGD